MTVSVGQTVQLLFNHPARGMLISGPRMVVNALTDDEHAFCVIPGGLSGNGIYAGTYKTSEIIAVSADTPTGMADQLQEIRSLIDPNGPYAVEMFEVPASGLWQFIIYQKENPQSMLDGFIYGTSQGDSQFIARVIANLTDLF